MEGEVLAQYADIRKRLLSRIRMLRVRMDALHRTSKHFSQAKANATAKLNSNSNSNSNSASTHLGLDSECDSDDASDSDSDSDSDAEGNHKTRGKGDALEEEQNINLEILSIEGEIEDLPERQDMDVRGVWAGWGAKWGVGTVGIHRELLGEGVGDGEQDWDSFGENGGLGDGERVGKGTVVEVKHAEAGKKSDGEMSDGSFGSDALLGSQSEVSTGKGSTSSVNKTGNTGLNRWGGRFDNVVVDCRMKLDWIRPDLPKERQGKRR